MMRASASFAIFGIFSIIILIIAAVGQAQIIVKTPNGAIRGYTHDNLHAFLGIPFAEPPVGEYRWLPPTPKASWGTSILNATAYGDCCPGAGKRIPGEDENCLTINVYVPKGANFSSPKLPVMVWIYGGAFMSGCSGQPYDRGDYIANSTDTILVSFNYRFGALGFLSTDAISGNFGMMDQVLALQWVQQNIYAFGGNKSQVTIFGESAGGMSVAIHLTSPLSTKYQYFRNAIIQSDPFAVQYRSKEQSIVYGKTFFELLGCKYDDLQCAKGKTEDEILSAQMGTYVIPWEPKLFLSTLPWEPIIDNIHLIGQPLHLLQTGNFFKLEGSVILGTTENETLTFAHDITSWLYNWPVYGWEYDIALEFLFGGESSNVYSRYPINWDDDALNTAARMTSDFLFICPTRNAASALVAHGIPVYTYLFAYDTPGNPFIPWIYCHNGTSCHAAELIYVFHTAPFYKGFSFTPVQEALSWEMIRYWTTMAHVDTPNTKNATFLTPPAHLKNAPGPLEWPRFDSTNQKMMNFDVPQLKIQQHYHKANCDYFDKIGYHF